ncbi:hypothetical protein BJX66DRAFT_333672 [Aspergillus keveii]|uniref:Uncharacterized protein n=1 Tax=Aspergillus keveii TaxID=714993 RepID=A0ABR4GIV5_9EURO
MHISNLLLVTSFTLASFAAAGPIDVQGNTTRVLILHNLDGQVVGERNLTRAEDGIWQNHLEQPELHTRSSNDIVFWEHTYTTCANAGGDTWCSPSYYDVEMSYTGWDVCEDTITVANFAVNPCWKSWKFYGNWYWVDQCDPNSDWNTVTPGTFVVLVSTFAISPICLAFIIFEIRGKHITDFREPQNLFTLAINSALTAETEGAWGSGPEGDQLGKKWHVGMQEKDEHYFIQFKNEMEKQDSPGPLSGETGSAIELAAQGLTRALVQETPVLRLQEAGVAEDVGFEFVLTAVIYHQRYEH